MHGRAFLALLAGAFGATTLAILSLLFWAPDLASLQGLLTSTALTAGFTLLAWRHPAARDDCPACGRPYGDFAACAGCGTQRGRPARAG